MEIKVYHKGLEYRMEEGQNLQDLAKLIYGVNYKKYLGCRINNRIYNLDKKLEGHMDIDFIDISNKDGYRIYTRTISAVFIKACRELYPDRIVRIEHFLGKGLYGEFESGVGIDFDEIKAIEAEMNRIIEADITIERKKVSIEESIEIFKGENYMDKVRLFETLDREKTDIYRIGNHIYSFHGYLGPSTGYADKFKLKYYYPGCIILFPTMDSPEAIPEFKEQKKLAKVFKEANKWLDILDLAYVGSLNEKIINGNIVDVIRIAEALQEKNIANIADEICKDENVNIILIAGPSSSGKTTFAERLVVQLKVNGKRPVAISADDYFVNREDTPLNPDGSPDFEAVEAIDLDLLNKDLVQLLEGKEIELPKFDFVGGKRKPSGKFIRVDKDHPIIVEGIHGLNPKLTREIPDKNKYKIYISALTQLSIDAHNRIPTTDTRLIRRIIRDNKYRGNDAIRSFDLWGGVRKGEEKHIFPFQEEADIMFDSALVYELAILKKHIEPLLREVDSSSEHYGEARKLLKFLEYFKDIEDESIVPPNSIIREFIGGSDKNIH